MKQNTIKIIQIGLGPLGVKINNFIDQRAGMEVIGAVDNNPDLSGKDLGEHCGKKSCGIKIVSALEEVIDLNNADIVVLTTVSSMQKIYRQVEEIVKYKLHVVSTCEELSFPWETSPELAGNLDKIAKENDVTILGTGVNPGFLMDALPSFFTAVSQKVDSIKVLRYQDAAFRRKPFQQKIGAGLPLEEFDKRKESGALRHVGLTESIQFIASKMGWKLDKTEDIIEPVISEENIATEGVSIKKGDARGVHQTGNGYINGKKVIELIFHAAVGEPESYDEVIIKGTPDLRSRIEGGVNGDIATCAITLNAIRSVLEATPGLHTMGTLPMVTYFKNL